jgi:hypothetical protein
MSYPIIRTGNEEEAEEDDDPSKVSGSIEPIETTILPYLDAMYGAEVEDLLTNCGTVELYNMGDDGRSKSLDGRPKTAGSTVRASNLHLTFLVRRRKET